MKDIDWKILTVLYEKRSMTKAAETLYMTQSALTKRIKAMETEWNIEIVRRSSKGVEFTEDGHYLVKKASIMLDFLHLRVERIFCLNLFYLKDYAGQCADNEHNDRDVNRGFCRKADYCGNHTPKPHPDFKQFRTDSYGNCNFFLLCIFICFRNTCREFLLNKN